MVVASRFLVVVRLVVLVYNLGFSVLVLCFTSVVLCFGGSWSSESFLGLARHGSRFATVGLLIVGLGFARCGFGFCSRWWGPRVAVFFFFFFFGVDGGYLLVFVSYWWWCC